MSILRIDAWTSARGPGHTMDNDKLPFKVEDKSYSKRRRGFGYTGTKTQIVPWSDVGRCERCPECGYDRAEKQVSYNPHTHRERFTCNACGFSFDVHEEESEHQALTREREVKNDSLSFRATPPEGSCARDPGRQER